MHHDETGEFDGDADRWARRLMSHEEREQLLDYFTAEPRPPPPPADRMSTDTRRSRLPR